MTAFRLLILSVLSVLVSCCTGGGNLEIYTTELYRKDFSDILVLEGIVDPIRSANVSCPMNVDGNIIYLIEDGTFVSQGDTLCIIEDNFLTQRYDDLVTRLETSRAGMEKTIADLRMNAALLEAQVQTNHADTRMAVRDSLELLYASPRERRIKELELQILALDKSKIDRKLDMLKVVDQTEIKKWEVEIQRHEMNLKQVTDRMASLVLTAPTDGLAIRATNRNTRLKMQEGDPVWSNINIISIPRTDEVKVTITASEKDFKYVSVGDSVFYTFDAMPANFASGKITNKTPVGREHTPGSKVKFFTIEASVDTVTHVPDPGFTANCNVVVRQLRDTVVVPQISIFEEDTLQVVYVKGKRGFEMRQVLTGISSSKEAVVTAGLEGNETIAMEKPAGRAVKGTVLLPDSLPVKPKGPEQEEEDPSEEDTETQTDN